MKCFWTQNVRQSPSCVGSLLPYRNMCLWTGELKLRLTLALTCRHYIAVSI